ncbi:MAG TPA: ZIP family metal transporter [Longimicrobiales bacterium]|nr:ZIP family metal transporter [Longimicrobiales bacterium]
MNVWLISLLSVAAVSLVSLAGLATLSFNEARIRRTAIWLVSFAVGALLGDAFIHLIPEAFERPTPALQPSLLILAGMVLFFLVEKLLRHPHGPLYRFRHPEPDGRPALAAINIIGDAIHNFIDGVLIGASYLVSPALGITTTLAVVLHEIPQELGDFGILIHSGLSVRRAALVNLASASIAIVGTVIALSAGAIAESLITSILVPVAAGGFVYIAAADLIPELQHDRSLRDLLQQTGLISLGILLMALLALVEPRWMR